MTSFYFISNQFLYFRATLEGLDFLVSRVKEVMKVPEEKLESQVQQDQLE
jgi:hypothetical protein